MSVRLIVFANCQANPLASTIAVLSPEVELVRCPPVHTIKKDETDAILSLIGTCDIIVHQPIGDGFGPVASDRLREIFPKKTFISFPSIYFGGLFPQLAYIRQPESGFLRGPLTDYHDVRILRGYLQHLSVAACAEQILNDHSLYAEHLEEALTESRRREEGVDLPIMAEIVKALAERPCLYTFNHPDNLILFKLAEKIVSRLALSRSATATPRQMPFLGEVSAAVPTGVSQSLGVSWRRNIYRVGGLDFNWQDLVAQFYDVYHSIANLDALITYNKKRLPQLAT